MDLAEAAFEAIACQAQYDGGYWQSTGIGRYVTTTQLLDEPRANYILCIFCTEYFFWKLAFFAFFLLLGQGWSTAFLAIG